MPKKIVLAYSGGLDTSIILRWLQNKYNAEVVAFTADIGQNEDLEAISRKAARMGCKEIFVENLMENLPATLSIRCSASIHSMKENICWELQLPAH